MAALFFKKYLIYTSFCLILGLLLCAKLRYPVVNVWGIRPTCKQSKYNFTFSFQAKQNPIIFDYQPHGLTHHSLAWPMGAIR
jgi:hypothetical protein